MPTHTPRPPPYHTPPVSITCTSKTTYNNAERNTPQKSTKAKQMPHTNKGDSPGAPPSDHIADGAPTGYFDISRKTCQHTTRTKTRNNYVKNTPLSRRTPCLLHSPPRRSAFPGVKHDRAWVENTYVSSTEGGGASTLDVTSLKTGNLCIVATRTEQQRTISRLTEGYTIERYHMIVVTTPPASPPISTASTTAFLANDYKGRY